MTPLAHRLTKQLLLPPRKRTMERDDVGLLNLMDDIHCFEVSAIRPLVHDLLFTNNARDEVDQLKAAAANLIEGKCFLPAPKTWLEWATNGHPPGLPPGRHGTLAIERDGWIWMFDAVESESRIYTNPGCFVFKIDDGAPTQFGESDRFLGAIDLSNANSFFNMASVYVALGVCALINTPKVIGRRQHLPNERLERKLLARRGEIGKFPLHAWTEIKLEVTRPPENLSDGDIHEAHLTGQKAYHFCRAHLRIKNGRVEFVKAHWRGDPSLGIKRSRYTVTP